MTSAVVTAAPRLMRKHPKLRGRAPSLESALTAPVKHLLSAHRRVAVAWRSGVAAGFFIDAMQYRQLCTALGGPEGFARIAGRPPRWVDIGEPGVSDFCGMLRDGRALALELKAPGYYAPGSVTPEQEAFLRTVREVGGLAFVANDLSRINDVLGGAELEEHKSGRFWR